MAFKLFNVSGNFMIPNVDTQTFTFTTDNVGFLDTQENALSFFQAVQSGKLALAAWIAEHPILGTLLLATGASGVVTDLLSTNFWQAVPQSHGVNVWCKYLIYPCSSSVKGEMDVGPFDFNYYREVLLQDLSNAPGCLRWAVQFYADENTTPLNDSTVEWQTPFYDIAEVNIPTQTWGTPGQEAFCAMMSFNPASTITEHRLVGITQKVRTAVYTQLGQLRRQISGQSLNDVTYQDFLNYPNL